MKVVQNLMENNSVVHTEAAAPAGKAAQAKNSLVTGKKSKTPFTRIVEAIFFICACVAVLCVCLITFYMVSTGAPAIAEIGLFDFLLGKVWAPTASDPQFGILPMVLSSILATLGAIVIGVPIGILASVFLAEIAPKRVAKAVRAGIEVLAGIPSVIYGLIGMLIIVPAVAKIFNIPLGMNLLSATLVLAVMILPTIISVSETALKSVPRKYKEASLACGATHIQTIFKVMIPAARSGIMTGVVLGIGRAVGETMAVIMVAGNVVNMPELLGSVRLMTTGIVMEMSYAGAFHKQALFAIGLILFVFIMVLNILLNTVLKKMGEKYE